MVFGAKKTCWLARPQHLQKSLKKAPLSEISERGAFFRLFCKCWGLANQQVFLAPNTIVFGVVLFAQQ